MSYNNQSGVSVGQGIGVASFVILVLIGLLILGMWGCPTYNVYSARKAGEAKLAESQAGRQVSVSEARAKMEAASLLAVADTLRAQGIAASNRIIGKSLNDNPGYLQWMFLDDLKNSQNQVIYIPSGNMGIPILEANRLVKPIPPSNDK